MRKKKKPTKADFINDLINDYHDLGEITKCNEFYSEKKIEAYRIKRLIVLDLKRLGYFDEK